MSIYNIQNYQLGNVPDLSWHELWLLGRQPQLADNMYSASGYYGMTPNDMWGNWEAYPELYRQLDNAKQYREYEVGPYSWDPVRSFYSLANIANFIDPNLHGLADNTGKYIFYNTNSNIPTTESLKKHEITHALNSDMNGHNIPLLNTIDNIMHARYGNDWIYDPDYNPERGGDYYYDNPDEIYARLMSTRYSAGLNPSDIITKLKLLEMRDGNNVLDYDKDNLLNRYDDDTLLKLFNEVAQNNTNNDMINYAANGGSIHINPKNKGKFNATKKRTGKTTEELTHSKNPLTRKRAIFALNAKKWKHDDGGNLFPDGGPVTGNGYVLNPYLSNYNLVSWNFQVPNDYYKRAVQDTNTGNYYWETNDGRWVDSAGKLNTPNIDIPIDIYGMNYVNRGNPNVGWHLNWLNNRLPQLAKNITNYDYLFGSADLADALEEANKQINSLKGFTEYSMFDEESPDGENGKWVNGLTNLNKKTIEYLRDPLEANTSTIAHERTHAMRPRAQENAAYKIAKEGEYNPYGWKSLSENPSYYNSPDEIYARLMEARYKYGLSPNQTVTKEMLDKMLEMENNEYKGFEYSPSILGMFDNETLLRLFNEVAQNDTKQEFNYAANGGDLINNNINNNNMYNKFETGGTKRPQYDEEAWHDYFDTDHLSLNDEPEYYAGRIPEVTIRPENFLYRNIPYEQNVSTTIRLPSVLENPTKYYTSYESANKVKRLNETEEALRRLVRTLMNTGGDYLFDPTTYKTEEISPLLLWVHDKLFAEGGEMQISPEEMAMMQLQGAEGMSAGTEQGMPVPLEGGVPPEMMGGQEQMSLEEMEEQLYEEERRAAFEEAREEAREEGKKTFEFEGRIYVTETGQLVNNEKACGGRLRGYRGNMFAYGGLDGPEPDAFNVGPTDPPYVELNDATYVVPNNVNPYRTVYNDNARVNNTYLKRFGTNFIGGPDIYPYWNITGPHKDNNYTTSYFGGGNEPKKDVLTPYELDLLILDNIRQRNYNKFIRDFNNKRAEGGPLDYDIEEPYPYDEGYTPEQVLGYQQFNDLEAQRREAYNQLIKNRIKERLLREYGITEDELDASKRREIRKKKKAKK